MEKRNRGEVNPVKKILQKFRWKEYHYSIVLLIIFVWSMFSYWNMVNPGTGWNKVGWPFYYYDGNTVVPSISFAVLFINICLALLICWSTGYLGQRILNKCCKKQVNNNFDFNILIICMFTTFLIWHIVHYETLEEKHNRKARELIGFKGFFKEWQALKRFRYITYLDFRRVKIREEDLKHLKDFEYLSEIVLFGVSDKALIHIGKISSLSSIDLRDTNITNVGLLHLKNIQNLSRLHLSDRNIDDQGLKNIESLKNIRWLDLDNTKISDKGLYYLRNFKKLERLYLENTSINGQGLTYIKQLKKLKDISLSGTNINDEMSANLAKLTSVTHLNLDNTNLSDQSLNFIVQLPNLTYISLEDTKISKEGINKLRNLVPHCTILFNK